MSRHLSLCAMLLVCSVAAADAPMGITLSGGTAEVRVWAPNAKSAAIVGEFNNWKPTQDDVLVKDDNTGIWSGTLRAGRAKGAYGFLFDGELQRRDPYARAVTPDGRHSVFYDPDAFDWGNVKPPRTALEDMVIYELHIGTFNDPRPADGLPATFDDAVRRLDYLAELGVNTLCLMPIHEFSGKHSWGYNPSDLFAVEHAYGGPDALKRFVRACHSRGIGVHVDIVHNHYGPQNLDLLQFDGSGSHSSGGIYFYGEGALAMTPWGPRVKYADPMVRRFVRDNIMMWLDEYHIDGLRWDSTINIRAYNNGASHLPEGVQMLEEINREIRADYPGIWSIAEDSYGIGDFHGSWDYEFHHRVMPALSARKDEHRDMHAISSALRRSRNMERVIYVDNHDEAGRLNGQRRIASDISPSKTGSDLVRKLSGVGSLLTLTAPGIPLLFMGNEFQQGGDFHDDRPVKWSNEKLHAGLLELHRALIALRLNRDGTTPGLKGRGVEVPLTDNDKNVLVYWRWHEDTPADITVVAVNLLEGQQAVEIPFPLAGSWTLRLDSDWGRFGGANRMESPTAFTIGRENLKREEVLPGYSARVFSLTKRPPKGMQRPVPASAKKQTQVSRGPKSMYASMHLAGNFNDWNPTNRAFQLLDDYVWSAEFTFDDVKVPTFKLSANDSGVIYWGKYDGAAPVAEGESVQVKRLGKPFEAGGPWNGRYRFTFNEDLLYLEVERVAGPVSTAPSRETAAADDDRFRVWTDRDGTRMTARIVDASGIMVSLETRSGQRVQLPANRFSEEDREFIDDWIDEYGD